MGILLPRTLEGWRSAVSLKGMVAQELGADAHTHWLMGRSSPFPCLTEKKAYLNFLYIFGKV